jgi:hypothetical protein
LFGSCDQKYISYLTKPSTLNIDKTKIKNKPIIKKTQDEKGHLIAQLQCSLAKIKMAAMAAPSVVKTMN